MSRLLPFLSFSLVLLLGGCIQPGVADDPRDVAAISKLRSSFRDSSEKSGFRLPNGTSWEEELKLIDVTQIESRVSAFGQRELKCRITTEVTRWKTIDGKRSGQPEVRRETEERWVTI